MRKQKMIFALILAIAAAGCESMGENTGKGAAAGGLIGATAGGIIGHQDGHGWEGALIGGAAGAVGGGLIGHQWDKKQQESNPQHITVIEIAEMGKKGIPDDVIISEIDRTRSKYELTSEVISYLKENGISDKVINHMMATM